MLSPFYRIVVVELLVLLGAIIFYIYATQYSDDKLSPQTCISTTKSSYEESLRIAATATIVPLVAEYFLDVLVFFCYPNLNEGHLLWEDRLGHGIIVLSLAPCSHIPLWLFGNETFCILKDSLIGLSQAMIVGGVVGKLQNFAQDIWSFKECGIVMTLFVFSQLCFVIGHSRTSIAENAEPWLLAACGLKTTCLVAFLSSCRNISRLLSEKSDSLHSLFTSRKYFCSVLSIGLTLFLGLCTLFCNYVLYKRNHNIEITANRILFQICAVLVLTVLPARIIRRGIIALENSVVIEREMTLKKTFVRYVSHEVRSPLSTTSLGIDCLINLLKAAPSSSARQELLELAQDCRITCSAAINTLNDLLLFDKIESNMLKIDKDKIYCKTFLQDSVRPFIRQLEVAGISFDIKLDPQIKLAYVFGDSNKLEQVIRNFIGNAVKFTPVRGKISVTVSITTNTPDSSPTANDSIATASTNTSSDRDKLLSSAAHRSPATPGKLRFSVTDTGAGISFENQQRLFQQYIQFNAGKLQGGKGSGLGLWISKSIIDMHQGTVGAYSEGEGKGSTFYFELPCEVLPLEQILEATPVAREVSAKLLESVPARTPINSQGIELDESSYYLSNTSEDDPNSLRPEFSRTVSTIVTPYEEDAEQKAFDSCSTLNTSQPVPGTTTNSITTIRSSPDTGNGTAKPLTPPLLLPLPLPSSSPLPQSDTLQQTIVLGNSCAPTPLARHDTTTTSSATVASPHSFYILSKTFHSRSSHLHHSFHIPSPATSPISPPPTTDGGKQEATFRPLKMLLADDTALTRKMVQRLLSPLNPIIAHASNGLDAVQQVKKSLPSTNSFVSTPFDVVIIDYFMPCMDGAEAIKQMRHDGFTGLICAVTGSTTAVDQDRLLSNGASMIMGKPFNYKIFYSCLKEYYQHTLWDPHSPHQLHPHSLPTTLEGDDGHAGQS